MRLHARYACVKQNSEEECGAACLATVARQHGKKVSMPLVRQLVGTGHQGTTLLMLAIAAYRGRRNVAAQVFDNLPGLLARQFRPDGSPRSSAADAPLRHEQLFNLQAWANRCVLSSALGRNLLAFTDSNDIGLQRAFQHAQGRLPSEGEEAAALPARTSGGDAGPDSTGCGPGAGAGAAPLAEASSGLPPFWSLCRAVTF
ncbi:MAG: cysteine peptidase family C39 domain-containing protein [Cyanobium sp.]